MSDRPVIFEVQMLDALGKPGRYRVSRNAPERLIFEFFPRAGEWSGEMIWQDLRMSKAACNALVLLGEQSGLLPDNSDSYRTPGSIAEAQRRAASALFVSPLLAPCGSCGSWCPIAGEECEDCGKDPRAIVEPCERCEGLGHVESRIAGDLVATCPRCEGARVTESETGMSRWRYLKRCVEAGILTEDQAGAAIIEE